MCIPFNLSKVELIEIDLAVDIHHFLQHCTQTGHCSLEKVSPNRIVSPFSNILCFLVLVCVCSDSHVTLMCRTYPQNIYGNVTNASAVWNNMWESRKIKLFTDKLMDEKAHVQPLWVWTLCSVFVLTVCVWVKVCPVTFLCLQHDIKTQLMISTIIFDIFGEHRLSSESVAWTLIVIEI